MHNIRPCAGVISLPGFPVLRRYIRRRYCGWRKVIIRLTSPPSASEPAPPHIPPTCTSLLTSSSSPTLSPLRDHCYLSSFLTTSHRYSRSYPLYPDDLRRNVYETWQRAVHGACGVRIATDLVLATTKTGDSKAAASSPPQGIPLPPPLRSFVPPFSPLTRRHSIWLFSVNECL